MQEPFKGTESKDFKTNAMSRINRKISSRISYNSSTLKKTNSPKKLKKENASQLRK